MTYPTAIVIAGVLVAGAIFASGYSAQSAGGESGRYRLYPDPSGVGGFRFDTFTGAAELIGCGPTPEGNPCSLLGSVKGMQ